MPLKFVYSSERFLKIIFGISLFIVLCMGGMAYQTIRALSNSFEDVQHTYQIHVELERLASLLKDAESGKRGFIISKDSTFLEPLFTSGKELDSSIAHLRHLTQDNPAQQKNVDELEIKINHALSIFEKTLQLAVTNQVESPEFIAGFKEGRRTMNSVRFKIMEMTTHENNILGIRKQKSSKTLSNAPIIVYYVLIISLLILLLIYLQISKNLKSLREKNELLETFKESTMQSEIVSKHGNWIFYMEDDELEFSDNLYRLLGEKPQSFESTLENLISFVHPDDVKKVTNQFNNISDIEDLPFINFRIIQRNGTTKHFRSYGKIIYDSEGRRKLLGITADITDEIENYRLIEERNLELERNNKELASFNYVASHDLQEPLRKIQTFISRLEDKEGESLSNNGKMYIARIKSSSARMRSLIDDLLQFSRTNKCEDSLEPTNINLLIAQAKQELAQSITEKKAKIISDSLPSMMVIPFQVSQLFLNLMSNSLKYSKSDVAPVIEILYTTTHIKDMPKVKVSQCEMYHTIIIKDNGIGFEQEYADKIFILFNRLHNKNEYSGTGIGLSICKKIVENHNGYIVADSVVNEGSTFTIYLPII